MAHAAVIHEKDGHAIQTTSLVHEAYLRMVKSRDTGWENRAHFFGVAARAMRRILVEKARARKTAKRSSGKQPLPFDDMRDRPGGDSGTADIFDDLETLDKALVRLASVPRHKRKCTVVELRFFVGLSHEETAEVMGISQATVARDWEFARAWLNREVRKSG